MSPRRRGKDWDMPTHVHWKHGAWRFKTPKHLLPYVPERKTWLRLGEDKQEALREYATLMGNLSKESGMAKLFNRYEAEVIPTKAPRTQRDNLKELKKLRAVFQEMHPSEVMTMHCQQYLDLRGKQSKTQANHEIALLSHIFRKATLWGIVQHNPVKGVEKHKVKARDRYVEDWELEAFLSVATPFIEAWVDVKMLTGLRQGDILKLSVGALREDGISVKTSKTGRKGLVEWTPELRDAVRRMMACNRVQGMTVVCNVRGEPLSEDAFRGRWKAVMGRALDETPLVDRFTEHDIRAKHATDFDASGGDATANLLHDDSRTTRTYLRSKKATKITPFNRQRKAE